MESNVVITPGVLVAHFASHLATAIREASSAIKSERSATNSHKRAVSISERISRKASNTPQTKSGDEQFVDQVILDIQALSEAMRHLPWLLHEEADERSKAITFHRKVIQALAKRFDEERSDLYRYDEVFLSRCLETLETL